MAVVMPLVESTSPPKRRKIQTDVHMLPRVQALHNADTVLAFHVLSDTIAPVTSQEETSTLGKFGFHAPAHAADGARMLQISWATSSSDVKERYIEVPGAVADGYGRPAADVLLEFFQCLLTMPKNFRLVTYQMENAAAVVRRR